MPGSILRGQNEIIQWQTLIEHIFANANIADPLTKGICLELFNGTTRYRFCGMYVFAELF